MFRKPDGRLTEAEIKKIVKWFYFSQLRQRYVSQTPQKLDKDLAIIAKSEEPFDELLGLIEQERSLTITEGEFVGRDVRHPLFSLMCWYFKHLGAVCLGSGVSIRRNMGKKYALERDHIFPYAALKENGYDVNNRFKYALAQEVTNRAILSSVENRGKSDSAAKDYLEVAALRFPSSLRKQCIPEDRSLWEIENFDKFLEVRRAILARELNTFLTGITEMHTEQGQVDIQDLIAEGEHDGLEFKSSLRWDTREHKVNKVLEKVVLKTIAAFSNGYGTGGKLIIGVDDDRTILGLENDYATLKGGDRDAFELHLHNLISSEFGIEYAAAKVRISFCVVSGQEVCVIDVARGTKPLFVEMVEKNGSREEKFFVRSGNASPPVTNPSEISSYIAQRFQ